ncbi:hypothetical protein GCM10022222_26520 [Amycolatopsis ultiminotia]|uniref:Uncharacterized protein n=1 Tax=Amycolatopsis ultiminotia TaxID=543629 RepID=A0ABP6VU83_9PSEU
MRSAVIGKGGMVFANAAECCGRDHGRGPAPLGGGSGSPPGCQPRPSRVRPHNPSLVPRVSTADHTRAIGFAPPARPNPRSGIAPRIPRRGGAGEE